VAVAIIMPKLGMAMSEGEVVSWRKAHGEAVAEGEPVVEVMSRKITYEVTAPREGRVHRVAEERTKWPVGAVLGWILAPGEAPPETTPVPPATSTGGESLPPAAEVLATPAAKRLAREHGVDLRRVVGSGPRGRIQEDDVRAFLAREAKEAQPQEPPRFDAAGVVEYAGMRAAVGERMLESLRTLAQVTLTTEVDASELVAVARETGAGVLAHLAVLVARALRRHPRLNANWDGEHIRLSRTVNLGIAVALDDGLLVPVVKGAERLDPLAMEREIRRLADAARAGTLGVDDVSGGTFTISNLGPYGVDAFTPIINPPEVAILGVGRVRERPEAVGGTVLIRPVLSLSLTFDHRALDGAPAAAMLKTLSRFIEHPALAWIEASESAEPREGERP
jgi:pyruvate dehydrogenase E2 component (dihydrolipoamide acetyltransferase)